MNFYFKALIIGAALTFFPPMALAAEEAVSLGDLLITPRRIPGLQIQESAFPGNVTVVSEGEIAASGAANLPDLLAQYEGVSLIDSRGFGLGADSGLNLRGFVNSSRTGALVLVNGVRQNRITGDEVHWLAIPMEQVERIEILRGGGGTIYGEGALSGVINIVTKRGGEKPLEFEGSSEIGSYLHHRSTALVRGRLSEVSYSLGVTRMEGGGYRDRIKSRGTTANLFAGWSPTPETQIDLHLTNHEDTSGYSGGLTTATVEQNRKGVGSFPGFFDDWQRSASLNLTRRLSDSWTVVSNLFLHRREVDSATPARYGSLTSTFGAGLRASHEFSGERWGTTTIFGVDWAKDKAVTGRRTATKSESNRWIYGFFVEEAIELLERLTVTLGFRYDKSRYDEDLTWPTFSGVLRFSGKSPKLGINYKLSDCLNLYGSAARAFKAPNIDDLDAPLPPYNDAVTLKPQQADHYEGGVRWKAAPWAKVKVAGFVVHTKDEILYDATAWANANYTTTRAGLEFNVSGILEKLKALSYYLTFSWTRARFHKGTYTGNTLPITPKARITGGLRLPVTEKLTVDLDALWVGKQFRINDFNNQMLADKYGVVNGTVEYRFPKAKVYFKVLNLLDEEYQTFPSSNGATVSTGENPAPPRTWVAGVGWDL